MKSETIQISLPGRKMDCIVLRPKKKIPPLPVAEEKQNSKEKAL